MGPMSAAPTLPRALARAGPAALGAVREGAGVCAAARARCAWARVLESAEARVARFLESEVAMFEHEGTLDEACARSAERACREALGGHPEREAEIAHALDGGAWGAWRATLEALDPAPRARAAEALDQALAQSAETLRAMVRARTKGWDLRHAAHIIWEVRARLQRARADALEGDAFWAPEAALQGGLARLEALRRSKWATRKRIEQLPHWLAEALLAETGTGSVPAGVLEATPEQWSAAVVRARAKARGLDAPRGNARAIARAAADWEGAAVTPPAMAVMSAGSAHRRLDTPALQMAGLDLEARGPQGCARAHWEAIVRESAAIIAELGAQIRERALASVARWAGASKAPQVLETLRATWPRGHTLDRARPVAATHRGRRGGRSGEPESTSRWRAATASRTASGSGSPPRYTSSSAPERARSRWCTSRAGDEAPRDGRCHPRGHPQDGATTRCAPRRENTGWRFERAPGDGAPRPERAGDARGARGGDRRGGARTRRRLRRSARARTAWSRVSASMPEALGRYLESEAALFSYNGSVEDAAAESAYEGAARALYGPDQWTGPVPQTLESGACIAWRAAIDTGAGPDQGELEHAVTSALYACTGALKSAVRMRTAGWRRQQVEPALRWARERLRSAREGATRTGAVWHPRAVLVGGLARLEALAHSRALSRALYRAPDPLPDWLAEAVLSDSGGGTVPAATLTRPLAQWTAEVVRAEARAAGLRCARHDARAIEQAARDWTRSRNASVRPPMMGVMAAGAAGARLDTDALRFAALEVEARGAQGGALEHWRAIEGESATVTQSLAGALRAGALASVAVWAGRERAEHALGALEERWRAEGAGHASGTWVMDTCEGVPGWRVTGGGVHVEMVRAQGDVRALERAHAGTQEVFVSAGAKRVRTVASASAPGSLAGRTPARWKAEAMREVACGLAHGGARR